MQCRECSASIASDVAFCPTCGARQVMAGPSRPGAQAQVSRGPAPSATAIRPPAKPAAPPELSPGKPGQVPAKAAKPALPQAGETFANRYRVEKYLGLGALCNTYLCRDTGAGNQEVVLKVMHARKAAEAGLSESFLFLAESVSKYDHKGIAKIHGFGSHEGIPYYTMEWVPGVPLRLWMMERLNFENRVLPGLGIIRSLLDIFEVIHERGCYGCLKPENIFIGLNGPVVTDFGVVGFLSPQEFEFNSYARRYLPYMAPELRQDWGNLVPHSDYYSLGAILYEILVGRAPAPQLRLPSELSRIFDIEADEIILKSMAARPLDRFGTVEAFKQAVVSLQNALMQARPPEEIPGLPDSASPLVMPLAHPTLEVTSDMQTVHDPEQAFAARPAHDPASPSLLPPGEAENPVASPWSLEGAPGGEEKGEGILSGFAGLGDPDKPRMVEQAHSQRRFVHAPRILPEGEGLSPNAMAAGQAWEGPDPEGDPADPSALDEEAADPVPAWLWISIALAGSCMVVLSAYFGLLHGN